MDNIIGRGAEKNELEEAYASNEAEFIAVYGRRRVGKTYLIRNFFAAKKCTYFQANGIYRGPLTEQLARFAKELGSVFYQGAAMKVPSSWMEAFEALTQAMALIPKNKKLVLFFDELPWMAAPKSGMIRALEYFWNRHWVNDKRIKLIVCGSAASWIIKKIIKNRGGLHNRVTRKIKLLPFILQEAYLYLKYLGYQCNHQQALRLYMVTGGVAFYLKQVKKNYSIDQNINHLFFDANGMFFDEFNEIFVTLFDDSEQYKELITLIANYKDGVPRHYIDTHNKLTGKGGRLTNRLEDLEYTGFITSFISFGNKRRGIFYRISDEYCYFYLKWIEPIKNLIKQDPSSNYWRHTLNTPDYYAWLGYTFENICYKHLRQIKKALAIDEASLASPWRFMPKKGSKEQGCQIDLLFDRNDDAITVCEIKYTEKPFMLDKQEAAKLQQKIAVFTEKNHSQKQIFLSLISANGIKKTLYSEEILDKVVTLGELFVTT